MSAVERALRVAGGRHSSLLRSGPELENDGVLATVDEKAGVTSIVVPGMMSMDDTILASYRNNLVAKIEDAAPSTTCGRIVDLRGNGGGKHQPMLAGLSPLVSDGKVAEFRTHSESFDVVVDGGTILVGEELVTSVTNHPKTTLPIATNEVRQTRALRGWPHERAKSAAPCSVRPRG